MERDSDTEEYDDYFGFINESKPSNVQDKQDHYMNYNEPEELAKEFTEKTCLEEEEASNGFQDLNSTEGKDQSMEMGEESFSIEGSTSSSGDFVEEYTIRENPARLWNKREYCYNLDQTERENIWKLFERRLKSTQRPTVIDKDIHDDAFYSFYYFTPTFDVAELKADEYVHEMLACENLRILNLKFLEYYSTNTKEIERLVQVFRRCNDPESKIVLEGVILQKKRIGVLIQKIRNYISSVTLKGEEAYNFLEKIYYIVFKKTSLLNAMSKASRETMSNSDCN